jgi:predicted signal transduction protein with EAL and GGDEF domain
VLRLQRALREGGAAQALRLRYLPRVDLASGRVQAVEALLRWHDGEHGLLPPAQFLALAERAGLVARSTTGCWSVPCTRPSVGAPPATPGA